MRNRLSAVAALASLLAVAALASACLQSPNDTAPLAERAGERAGGPEPIGEAPQAMAPPSEWRASDFPFEVQVKDDGEGKAAGWQRSLTFMSFDFSKNGVVVYKFKCPTQVGMPIRAQHWGTISRIQAARMTAEVANEAVPLITNRGEDWDKRGTEFCYELFPLMERVFAERYPKLGAKVQWP
jgi:hypothetical protein